MRYTLYIGNKNYSSWSMRPWVLMRQSGIDFAETKLRFDSLDENSAFKKAILAVNPAGQVPVLVDNHPSGEIAIWDSLAVCEYLAEHFPDKHLWPRGTIARARARSVCAEMHAGFSALRSFLPMNVEAVLPEIGQLMLRDRPAVRNDVMRLVEMWSALLRQHGGPMLFGEFCVADAFFAPVCLRFRTYGVPLPEDVSAYVGRVCGLASVAAWTEDACNEADFVPLFEPYRLQR